MRVGSSRKELFNAPVAIGAVAEVRVSVDHLDGFVEGSTLNFGHFGLEIGVPNIQMLVRDNLEGPLLAGINRDGEVLRAAANLHINPGRRAGREFRYRELNPILSKVPIRGQIVGVFLPS